MLTYITIGTNDLQRAVAFYDAIFNVLGYSRLPAWTEDWAMWGDENNPDEGFSFCNHSMMYNRIYGNLKIL